MPKPKTKTKKKTVAPVAAPESFHIDKRAASIVAASTGTDDDELLSTPQMAIWFGVSEQWLAIRRGRGGGPPYEQLGPRCIRYRRGKAKQWLDTRTRTRTRTSTREVE